MVQENKSALKVPAAVKPDDDPTLELFNLLSQLGEK